MTQNEKVIASLREAADWIEAHPELPDIYVGSIGNFSTYGRDVRKDLVTVARAMGDANKEYFADYFSLQKVFGKGTATISYSTQREKVCERVVVGTKTEPPVPEKIIPAQPAREVEIVEWRCKPLMNQDQLDGGLEELPAPDPEPISLVVGDDDIPF